MSDLSKAIDVIAWELPMLKGAAKQAFLEKNAENEVLKEMFRLAYAQHLNFYVRPEQEWFAGKETRRWASGEPTGWLPFKVMLGMLMKRKLPEPRRAVKNFLQSSNLTAAENCVYFAIMNRDLRVGVNTTTIAKVWPDLLVNPDSLYKGCMLAHEWDEKKLKLPADADPKMDGFRVLFLTDEEGVARGFTRNGNRWPTLRLVEKELSKHRLKNMMIDGEFMHKTNFNATSSIMKRLKEEDIDWEKVAECNHHVFDALTLEDYVAGGGPATQEERRAFVAELVAVLGGHFRPVRSTRLEDMAQLEKFYQACLDDGYEGIIVKQPDAPYRICKPSSRPTSWMKRKPTKDVTVTITGYEEGRGKIAGMLGAFVCVDAKGGEYNMGGGMTDAQRQAFWRLRKKMIGTKIDVTMDDFKGDGIVARFGRLSKRSKLNQALFLRERIDI